jgi:hypothetical protein
MHIFSDLVLDCSVAAASGEHKRPCRLRQFQEKSLAEIEAHPASQREPGLPIALVRAISPARRSAANRLNNFVIEKLLSSPVWR